MRRIVLVLVNVVFAVVLAASLMPVAIIMVPVVRSEPHIGHAVFIATTMSFIAMNAVLWRAWRQR